MITGHQGQDYQLILSTNGFCQLSDKYEKTYAANIHDLGLGPNWSCNFFLRQNRSGLNYWSALSQLQAGTLSAQLFVQFSSCNPKYGYRVPTNTPQHTLSRSSCSRERN